MSPGARVRDAGQPWMNSGPSRGEMFTTSTVGPRRYLALHPLVADAFAPESRPPAIARWIAGELFYSQAQFVTEAASALSTALGYHIATPPHDRAQSKHAADSLAALRDALRADGRLPTICVHAERTTWSGDDAASGVSTSWRPWPQDAPTALQAAIGMLAIACFAPPLILWRRRPNPHAITRQAAISVRLLGTAPFQGESGL